MEQVEIQRIMSKFGYFYEIKRGDRRYLDTSKEKHNLLKLGKNDFEYWDEKIDIESLASLWMAYDFDPSLNSVSKSNIFGYAKDKYYDIVFKAKEIEENLVKEMILAYNIMNCIENQSSIYGNRQKDGQIISKLTQLSQQKIENFDKKLFSSIETILDKKHFLSKMVLKDLSTIEIFLENKDRVLDEVKKYYFFPLGKYLILHVFQIIIRKCNYTNSLLSTDLFKNKNFIDGHIVKNWLKGILDIVQKEYSEFENKEGASLKAFFTRGETSNKVKKELTDKLPYAQEKELQEIFPLDMSGSH